ncbi:hypothetical protein DFH06DRAFT_1134940 [Mycena polygramma]|nr:hypothetical protein DFH06DRAFT_1134940 [Mycena polygramma]
MTSRVQKGGPIFKPLGKARARATSTAPRQAATSIEGRGSVAPTGDEPTPSTSSMPPPSMPPPATLPVRGFDPDVSHVEDSPTTRSIVIEGTAQTTLTFQMNCPSLSHRLRLWFPRRKWSPTPENSVKKKLRKRKKKDMAETDGDATEGETSEKPKKTRKKRAKSDAVETDGYTTEGGDSEKPKKARKKRAKKDAGETDGDATEGEGSEKPKKAKKKRVKKDTGEASDGVGKPKRKRKAKAEAADNVDGEESTSIRKKRKTQPLFDADADPGEEIDPTVITMAELCVDNGQGRISSKAIEIQKNHLAWKQQSKEKRARMKALAEQKKYVQVRIGPNGETIIDEESLTVDRTEDVDTTNYTKFVNSASYTKKCRGSRWSAEETDLFYEALSQHGENYELISLVLPGRSRTACKNKFKTEDKKDSARINRCLENRIPIDMQTLTRITGRDFSGPVPIIKAPTPPPVPEPSAEDRSEPGTPHVVRKRSRSRALSSMEGVEIIGDADSYEV